MLFRSQKPQQPSDAAVAVPPVPARKRHDGAYQPRLVRPHASTVALARAGLPQCPTRLPLRDAQLALDLLCSLAATRRTQKFPSATSFKIALSIAISAKRELIVVVVMAGGYGQIGTVVDGLVAVWKPARRSRCGVSTGVYAMEHRPERELTLTGAR